MDAQPFRTHHSESDGYIGSFRLLATRMRSTEVNASCMESTSIGLLCLRHPTVGKQPGLPRCRCRCRCRCRSASRTCPEKSSHDDWKMWSTQHCHGSEAMAPAPLVLFLFDSRLFYLERLIAIWTLADYTRFMKWNVIATVMTSKYGKLKESPTNKPSEYPRLTVLGDDSDEQRAENEARDVQ